MSLVFHLMKCSRELISWKQYLLIIIIALNGFRRRSKKAKAFYVNLNRQIGYRETHTSKMRHNNSKASYIIIINMVNHSTELSYVSVTKATLIDKIFLEI